MEFVLEKHIIFKKTNAYLQLDKLIYSERKPLLKFKLHKKKKEILCVY